MYPVDAEKTFVDAKEILDIARRQRVWLVGPLLGLLTLGSVGAFLWPDTYVSSAVFRIVPPAASGALIPDPIRVGMADRVAAMQQSILSRATLTALIDAHNLYPSERKRVPLEDVIENMKRDVAVAPVTAAASPDRRHLAFRVAFSYPNRFDAYRVTQSLVARFLHENKAEQEHVLDSVNRFLRDEFERADAELRAVELQVAQIRRTGQHAEAGGGVPMHRLPLLETRASVATAGLARARQEMILAETEVKLARERVRRAGHALPRIRQPQSATPSSATTSLELELETLLARYKPSHPDVLRLRSQIEALGIKMAGPVFSEPTPVAANAGPDPEATERVIRAEAQLRAKALEIANFENEATETSRAATQLEATIGGPVAAGVSSSAGELSREHELALQRHREARRRLLEGEAASKGNRWNLGETLELVDAPALPESPIAPNRLPIVAASAILGLLAGMTMVWLRESNSEAIWSIRQLRHLDFPRILGGIPLIEEELVVRRRRRAAFAGWASASVVSLVSIAAAAIYHHYRQP